MRFHFDPTEKLSAAADGHLRHLIGGDATTVTFNMLGKDGKTYDNIMSCIVASNAKIDQFAPNMYYIGAATKFDPATIAIDTGSYNMCGKIYEYTFNMFNDWGTDGSLTTNNNMKANYIHPAGRSGMRYIYYTNFGKIGQIENATKAGTSTKALDDMEYDIPESLDEISATYLMNDCLSAAITNTYNEYSAVDPGEDPEEGQQPA